MKYIEVRVILFLIMIFIFCMSSCTKNTNEVISESTSAKDSWSIIQENILTPTCATSGCHASTNDANYAQHNLLLTSATAYDNLINIIAKNPAAKTAGLVMVKPGDFMSSLLYQKVDCQTTLKYGALMPLGGLI